MQLDYACFGNPNHPPLLLIMGLATQRTAWPESWIDAFVESGFYVITFDNRDIGLSTRLDHLGEPSMVKIVCKRLLGVGQQPPYSLRDMAGDTLMLLDQLDISSAHVLGISMGGMIAQWLALMAPKRVRTLSLLMTSSGRPFLPGPDRSVFKLMRMRPSGADRRRASAEYLVELFRIIGSPGYPVPEHERLARALAQVDRSMAGLGAQRQLAAIVADGERWRRLSQLSLPCQILHGDADKMVPLAHGRDLHRRIPGSRFEVFPGLGHDLPEALAPVFAQRVQTLAGRM